MRKYVTLSILAVLTVSLTSCWEFQRQQHILDKEAEGKGILVEAENSKKAMIEQARAENESAELQAKARIKIAEAEAQAEIVRAKGVAEANRIIGESLKGNEAYLRYLWVNGLHNGNNQTIYIPTEAGMPILEAGKR